MKQDGQSKATILTYHSIDDSGSVISTSRFIFERQMRELHDRGYRVLPLRTVADALRTRQALPDKVVALTFDDGFQNFRTTAFPILEKYGFPSTVFLVSGYAGKTNDWDDNPPNIPRQEMLSWQEVEELSRSGVEFGAHTVSHRDLTAITHADAKREMADSKAEIEARIGREVTQFAYPYGTCTGPVKHIASELFDAAYGTRLGRATADGDMHSIERVDTFYLKSERIFGSIDLGSFDLFLRFRQTLRNIKRIAAGIS